MSKRPAAVLLALLIFAATLVVVAQPAAAHSQTVQRCAYDPFTNTSQCWDEAVSHAHSCPANTTGTYPNCYPVPPDNKKDTDDEEARKKAEEARKRAEEERKRKEAEEAERKRREAEEAERKRKEAEEAERKRKEAEEAERKRKEAEHKEAERKVAKRKEAERKEAENKNNDPCGDYAEDLVDALSKAGHTGTYNPPTNPGNCDGPSTAEIFTVLKGYTEAEARRLLTVLKALQEAPDTVGDAGVEAIVALADKIEEEWEQAPPEVKAGVTAVVAIGGCIGLASLVVKSSTASAGTALAGWGAYFRTPAGKAAVERTCGIAVPMITAFVTHRIINNDSTDDDSDENDGGDNPDPNNQKNIDDDAEDPELEEAKEALRRAREAWQADPSLGNAWEYSEANRRYGCLTGELKSPRLCNR